MKPLLRSVLGLALLSFWQAVDAHPGGLNAQGCHNNRKTGGYHCHRSQTPAIEVPRRATPDLPKAAVVKKSRSGICHTPQSPYYARTTNYQSFDSLESCLQNGGGSQRARLAQPRLRRLLLWRVGIGNQIHWSSTIVQDSEAGLMQTATDWTLGRSCSSRRRLVRLRSAGAE